MWMSCGTNVPILSKRCEWVVHMVLFVCQWYFTLQVFYKTLEQLIFREQLSSIPTFYGSMLLILFFLLLLGFILPSSCVLCPMLLVSLDCPFVTTPVVFSNVNCRMRVHKTTNILLEKPTRVYVIRSTFLSFPFW